jgi:hypothetical protein
VRPSDSDAVPDREAGPFPEEEDEQEPVPRPEVESALRNLLHHLTEHRLVQADLSATLKALIETLVTSGAMVPEQFERRRQRALDVSMERLRERPHVQIAAAVDKYAVEPALVDCASLLPICEARCCRLGVCLSAQDLDEGVLQWNYGKPYELRKAPDGWCTHSDPQTRGCTVYGQRPTICRSYDCRTDKRIWLDFEKKITAWAPDEAAAGATRLP